MDILPFGETASGETVRLARMAGAPGCYCEWIGYGGALRSLVLPDRHGWPVDVCLGYDTLAEYERHDGCMGAMIGRCANRIGHASFDLNGKDYRLAPNDGPNHLHGGWQGFDKKVWSMHMRDDALLLSLLSPNGEEGYPGNLSVTITCRFNRQNILTLDYEAVSDADTIVNLTNHAYWNMAGHGSGSVVGHQLQLAAGVMTEADARNIPTGRLLPVDGTPFDFRTLTPLSFALAAGGLDHNFVSEGAGLRPVARLECHQTGIAMEVCTTLPGLQVYSAAGLTPRTGKGGAHYASSAAICLETQFLPDAVHQPQFPSVMLRAGEMWHHRTEIRFTVEKE